VGASGTGGAGASGETNAGTSNGAGAAAGGASGGQSGEAPPDIAPGTLITSLDATQEGALCDWYASVFGGYGHVSQCGMGTVAFPKDQQECLATSFPGFCKKATVGQYEDCARAGIPSHGCDLTDECRRLYCM